MRRDVIDKNRNLIAIILILALVLIGYFRDVGGIQEKVSAAAKAANRQKEFKLEDLCGPMPGGGSALSHTIPSEESCENTCRARCVADDIAYKKIIFTPSPAACNTCECFCK